MTIETRLFIDGEYIESKSGKTFPLYNPYTEEKVADVSEALAEDVDIAVKAAQMAFPAWSDLSAMDRATLCLKLAELIDRDRDQIARLDAISMGMPVSEYLPCIDGAIGGIKHASGLIHDIHGETSLHTPGFVNISFRQPFGVCAAIIPWNVPIVMFCGKLVPCILAGNTIVIKSSEKAPLSSIHLAGLCAEAGFPPGVVNVITGFGQTAGAPLAEHMDIRKLSFTGSTRTGKVIAAAAAKSNLKNVCVETGGKNPAVIFEDADLDRAVASCARSIQFNAGQICVSDSRVYVHEDIVPAFVKRFKEKFAAVKLGDPTDPETRYGPQADKVQFETVMRYIEKGKEAGGDLVLGGERAHSKGFHIQPTMFVNVPEHAEIIQEEIFGPVVAIQTFKTEEEVIKRCNATQYGLHAAVFTKDVTRALRMVKAFEAGMVTVNCGSTEGPYDLPFGGYKASGLGRENGKMGLESYFEVKSDPVDPDRLQVAESSTLACISKLHLYLQTSKMKTFLTFLATMVATAFATMSTNSCYDNTNVTAHDVNFLYAAIASDLVYTYTIADNSTITFDYGTAALDVHFYVDTPFPVGVNITQAEVLQQLNVLVQCCQVSRYITNCAGSSFINVAYNPPYGFSSVVRYSGTNYTTLGGNATTPANVTGIIITVPGSPEEQQNQRVLGLLVYALQNVVREVGFFDEASTRWGLDVKNWRERKATRDYMAEMTRVSTEGTLFDGLVFVWAMEQAYLDAWRYVGSVLERTGRAEPPDQHAVASFVANWTNPEFVKFVDDLADVVNSYGVRPGSQEWARAEMIWARVLELEEAFWPEEGEETMLKVAV
ncbi:hypothetical protein BZG36_02596 [Bifiguratus adelaidae]|uniref:Aldehyde dehydrogenase domain-containing protein n=1 Tax=Bifiguratus adelaidae TaxID=1938954 RepID=A0A261Y2M1_9FUNG|nr:hypothetical protein BZG36_02596 [Bifiguratus adelaidae]